MARASREPSREPSREHGVATVIVIFCMLLIIGLTAFIIDLGIARQIRRQAQNAADAAALAGAGVLWRADGTFDLAGSAQAVADYAEQNANIDPSEWAGCAASLPSGWSGGPVGGPCIAYDNLGEPTRIQVTLPARRSASLFGAVAGVNGIDVRAVAQAQLTPPFITECTVCIGPLTIDSNGSITVRGGGGLRADSSTVPANGSVTVMDGGTIQFRTAPTGNGVYTPAPTIDPAPIPDPYSSASLPPLPADPALPATPDQATRAAGVICDAAGAGTITGLTPGVWGSVSVIGDCPVDPGVYYVVGDVALAGPGSSLRGSGVTLYFLCGTVASPTACAPGQQGGSLVTASAGVVDLASPSSPYPWTLVYDRNNTATTVLSGASGARFGGGVYALRSAVTLQGNAPLEISPGQLVVASLALTGGSGTELRITRLSPPRTFVEPDFSLQRPS